MLKSENEMFAGNVFFLSVCFNISRGLANIIKLKKLDWV